MQSARNFICVILFEQQPDPTAQEQTPVLQGSAAEYDVVRVAGVPSQGLEPVSSSPQKTPLSGQGNAESNALSGDDERLRVLL